MGATEYWLWLSSAPQVSARSKAALAEYYGGAEAAFLAPSGEFSRIDGVSRHDAEILERRDMSGVPRIYALCRQYGIRMITMADGEYPARLRNIFAPPVALYVKGKLPPVDERAVIAVVGTRKATDYGLKMSRRLAYEITKCGGTVVSGLTAGIDSMALSSALDAGGECIAVLGLPIELERAPLTKRIAAHGALVSEYPPGTKPYKSFFRERNRITAGLSLGVAAVEAPEKSGTSLFIAEAAEQGKEIFAVPGNADSPNSVGTNGFIRDGAKPVTCGWDILCEFETRWNVSSIPCEIPDAPRDTPAVPARRERPAAEKPQKAVDNGKNTIYIVASERMEELPDDQRRIISVISGGDTLVDDIITSTGLAPARVLSQLTVLEIKGLIERLPGRRIALKANTAKK